jgi:hypothetical protein
LNDALDVVDPGDRNMEIPIAIAPRDRARDAPAGRFIESARGKPSAGRLPACSLAMAWRKSSQMMSPTSGQ